MANVKITDLAEDTTLADSSLVELASFSGGVFSSKKTTLSTLAAYVIGKVNAALTAAPLPVARGGTGGGTASNARASLGVGTIAHPGYVAGRWYWASASAVGFSAAAANQIRLHPFVLSQPVTVSDLSSRLSATAAGSMQIAIYAADATTHMPTTLVAASASISTAAAGPVSASVGSAVLLQPGLYWQAVNIDNAAASYQQTHNAYGPASGYLMGAGTLASLANAGFVSSVLTVAQTFGTWPSLTSASFTEAPGLGPVIGFRSA